MQITRVSNYGTATHWVARTGVQGIEILTFCQVPEQTKLEGNAALIALQERLAGLQISIDQLAAAIASAFEAYRAKGPDFNWRTSGTHMPTVPDLKPLAEGFLQAAKITLAATTAVIAPFFGGQFDHRFDRVVKWAAGEFGADDEFTKQVRNCEAYAKRVYRLRDAIEHPIGSRFYVLNVQIANIEGQWLFGRPGWGIEGESASDMLADMETIVDGIVSISEILVSEIFYKLRGNLPLDIVEIAEEDRDPQCPVRYRVMPVFAPPADVAN